MQLQNNIIVITGGATGTGSAIIQELLSHNTVISIDRNPAKITALRTTFPGVISLRADVTRSDEVEAVLTRIGKDFGRIDLLINNAGAGSQFDFETIREADLVGYCATKSAMHVFTMSLRHQLRHSKIRIVEVLPPTVDTDFNRGINAPKMAPATFAKAFVAQLAKGKTVINIGQSAALALFSRFMPKLAFRMLNRAPK